MTRLERKTEANARSRLLYFERLENRMLLTAVTPWEPQSLARVDHDSSVRNDSPVVVQSHDAAAEIHRSSNREDARNQAASGEGNNRTIHQPQSQARKSWGSGTNAINALASQLRSATDGIVSEPAQPTPRAAHATSVRLLSPVESRLAITIQTSRVAVGGEIRNASPDTTPLPAASVNVDLAASPSTDAIHAEQPSQIRDASAIAAHSPTATLPLDWWNAEGENFDQQALDSGDSTDTETNRFGGVIDLDQMPLLRDTLPSIGAVTPWNDQVANFEPGEDVDDSRLLADEGIGSLEAEEPTSEPFAKGVKADISSLGTLPTNNSDAIDLALADPEMLEEFGGMIDVPQEVDMAKAMLVDRNLFETIFPVNALHVDVIMDQVPLLELDAEQVEEDGRVPITIQSVSRTSAVMTLIPTIAYARRRPTRNGSRREYNR